MLAAGKRRKAAKNPFLFQNWKTIINYALSIKAKYINSYAWVVVRQKKDLAFLRTNTATTCIAQL